MVFDPHAPDAIPPDATSSPVAPDDPVVNDARRDLLKALATGAGYVAVRLALPAAWSAPVIASMSLPAHAQTSEASCDASTQPATGGVVSVSVASRVVSVTMNTPAAAQTNRQAVYLCEINPAGQTNIVSTLVPSGNAVSAKRVEELTRAPGTYKYFVRWGVFTSETVSAEVK